MKRLNLLSLAIVAGLIATGCGKEAPKSASNTEVSKVRSARRSGNASTMGDALSDGLSSTSQYSSNGVTMEDVAASLADDFTANNTRR